MKKTLLSVAILSSVSLGALAEPLNNSGYVGASANFLSYEDPDADATLVAVTGKLGAFVHENIAVEARLGLGVIGDEANIFGTNIDIDLNY
jgi:hypothetical protein